MPETDSDFALAPNDYLLLIWFFNLTPELHRSEEQGGDMMGYVYRPGNRPTEGWRIEYRMRYYTDERIFDGADRKNWFALKTKPEPEAQAEARIKGFLDALIVETAGKLRASIDPEIFYVRGTPQKLVEMVEAGRVPCWLHGRPKP